MASSNCIETPTSVSELTTPFLIPGGDGTQMTDGDNCTRGCGGNARPPRTMDNTNHTDVEITENWGRTNKSIEGTLPPATSIDYGYNSSLSLGRVHCCNTGGTSKTFYCYCCDNLRHFVVIVNVLALIVSGIMMYDVVVREKEQQQQQHVEESCNNLMSIFWNQLVSMTSDHSSSATMPSSSSSTSSIMAYLVGLVLTAFGFIGFPLCGIIGAVRYNKNFVVIATTWYSLYATFMILSFHSSVWIETIAIVLFYVYPHVLFLQEMMMNSSATNSTLKS